MQYDNQTITYKYKNNVSYNGHVRTYIIFGSKICICVAFWYCVMFLWRKRLRWYYEALGIYKPAICFSHPYLAEIVGKKWLE